MIDKELAAFLEEGLSIFLGTRDAARAPNAARVIAATVDDDGEHLVAYVPAVASERVLRDLADNGHAALVFARPTDDRGYQVKGVFTGSREASADERDHVLAQWDRVLANFERIGLPRALTAAWVTWPCVAVRVKATAIFVQTPGPGAGASLT